jgi:hypothetical protein
MRFSISRLSLGLVIVAAFARSVAAVDVEPSKGGVVELPGGIELAEVDFEQHVTSVLGRLGCNSAACHGAFDGKGGFQLSLFGQSPDKDYAAVSAGSGRVDVANPEESLLLAKPSGREDHGGGLKLPAASWEYKLLHRWIAAGAKRGSGNGALLKLAVDPADIPPLEVGQSARVRVVADFANGQKQDVTPFVEFRVRNEDIVSADAAGNLVARTAGDTSLIVSYRGTFLGIPVIVPHTASESPPAPPAAAHWIDEEVNSRLVRLRLATSPHADDAQFLRRVSLDVIGIVPTPEEVRAFLADNDPDKRAKKIDALLAHPRRAALWATKMCDVTSLNIDQLGAPEQLRSKRAKMWHDWFRKRFAQNMPYDQIVEGVLCATSRRGQSIDTWISDELALEQSAHAGFETDYANRASLDLFWRRLGPQGPLPVEDLAELTAAAFLGLRLHCARCHQHPYDHWTQEDFAGYANIFSRVEFGSSTDLRLATVAQLEQRRRAKQAGNPLPEFPRLQEVFLSHHGRQLIDAVQKGDAPAKAPGGPLLSGEDDSRVALFRWMTRPDNPYFAANFVNRIWARYFGAGLVEPVDGFSSANPATHPRLLERLSKEFVDSGYDIQHIERLILSSQVYQRSSGLSGNNASDCHNHARATVRPLMAEVLIDSLNAGLEAKDQFGTDVPSSSQAIELAPNRFFDPALGELLRILGRGDRKALCECNRAASPTIRQPLLLMSDSRVLDKIKGGRLARLIEQKATDDQIVNEFYLALLSREPDADEREFAVKHVAGSIDRVEGLADIVWALVNSREFTTNH